MKSRIIAVISLLVMSVAVSSAQTRADSRQTMQRVRIHEGIKDGEVTRRETRLLGKQQRQIQRSERRAKADGRVTAREKIRLERKQDRASRNIHRAKNNGIDKKVD